MTAALAEACGSSRFVFVVGKGGVGKTTSAGALAVLLAADGTAARLISTDPAHSLGDLFGIRLQTGTARVCDGMLLEAFDAEAYASAWSASVRPRLAEIIEAGTYLDDAEVASFLDLSLPGIDELMAALRLSELADGEGAVVVDTAPTGHTLRLLDAADLIDGWLATLRAMAAKGAIVASRLTGTPLRLTGESALDEMAAAAGSFRRLLADATFLVVERADAAVRAETDRLLAWLADRQLRVGAVLHVGPGPARTDRRVIQLPAPDVGADRCASLLALARSSDLTMGGGERGGWRGRGREGRGPGEGVRAGAGARLPDGEPTRDDARIFLRAVGQRILLFAGKGGVGKSTCAAAAAIGLADTRDVLLVSTDPAGSLGDLLERDVGGEKVNIGGSLTARQIDAAALLRAARERHRAEIAEVFERVGLAGDAMDRTVIESVWDLAPPGADEVMALIELTEAEAENRVMVVDAAPTGHLLRLLEMPELAGGWTRALLRVLARYRTAIGLDDVTARLLAFAKQLRALRSALTDPAAAGVFVVTLDEPLVSEETERLSGALAKLGTHIVAYVVNRAHAGAPPKLGGAGGVPVFAAPELSHPPLGEAALSAFLDSWKRVA